jgi:hypothetical protein
MNFPRDTAGSHYWGRKEAYSRVGRVKKSVRHLSSTFGIEAAADAEDQIRMAEVHFADVQGIWWAGM